MKIKTLLFLLLTVSCLDSSFNKELDEWKIKRYNALFADCLLYTSPSPRDRTRSRMPSSA